MKRSIFVLVSIVLALPSATHGKDMKQKWGLGYFNSDAPVGVRFWINEKTGLDFGIGFKSEDVYSQGANNTVQSKTATSIWFDAGVPIIIFPTERANFFVRPGLMYASKDNLSFGSGSSDANQTEITLSGTLAAELFFGEHFSLEAGHGLRVRITSIPEEALVDPAAGETITEIETFDASLVYLGFHFYFK